MNMKKKLDRMGQWGKEKMGGEVKTNTSEDFKALETEMNLRHEGMKKLQTSMNTYVKSLNERSELLDKEKRVPVGHLGAVMTRHGEDFEDGNKFGECLIGLGQANERIARMQEGYASNATSTWLDAVERSVVQMKDYQNARKKLESRRLAYDTSLTKMQKGKKEDYKSEEEVRGQKAKYEESTEDVYRRMQDIVDAENDNVVDLFAFLEAELSYHERCRDVLYQLKNSWPLASDPNLSSRPNPGRRSRTNTLSRMPTTTTIDEDSDIPRLPIRSRQPSGSNSPIEPPPSFASSGRSSPITRPSTTRRATDVELPSLTSRPAVSRTATEASLGRAGLRSIHTSRTPDVFADDSDENDNGAGWGAAERANGVTAKKPPPPPPSRASKPRPPPPPVKRSGSIPLA